MQKAEWKKNWTNKKKNVEKPDFHVHVIATLGKSFEIQIQLVSIPWM